MVQTWITILLITIILLLIGIHIISIFIYRKKLKDRNHQLEESQALLFQKDRFSHIGQIAAAIAHEINNPLTGIINGTQFLSEQLVSEKEPKINEDLLMIRENTERIKLYVNHLMNYGGNRLSFQTLQLNDIIEKALRVMDAQINQSNIVVQKNIDRNLSSIQGDEDRLMHVVFHVLINAIEALDMKYPKIGLNLDKILFITTFMEDRFIVAKIRDFGVGISDENKDLIFKPFFTTKNITGSQYGGTGLGLNICARIMAEHGASIQVHSKENEWTEVTLKFKKIQI